MATEKRLIDANECYEMADKCYAYFYHHVADLPILRNLLNNCPTVDAVEVVRCKDCKHWCTVDCEPNYGSCSKLEDRYKEDCESSFDETTRFDDFCSYGERRTDEH